MRLLRTIPISTGDPDYRRRPTTDYYCVNCHKPLDRTKRHRLIHIIDGGSLVLHPDDEHGYRSDNADCGLHPIGTDCAKRYGLEWSVEA